MHVDEFEMGPYIITLHCLCKIVLNGEVVAFTSDIALMYQP